MKFSWKMALHPMHLGVSLGVFILDQITKYWIAKIIPLGDRIDFLPFLNLVHTKNRGAAFGMFHDSSPVFRLVFFGAVTIVCLYLLFFWLGTTLKNEKWQRLSLSLILGGALGNLLDRALYGQVTDFIHVFWADWHFPAFNVADSAITVGVTLLFWKMLRTSRQRVKTESD